MIISVFEISNCESSQNQPLNLKDLFTKSEYRMNANSSSTCNYTGIERQSNCHKINVFNGREYQKYINELRRTFLNLLNVTEKDLKNMPKQTNTRLKLLKRVYEANSDDEYFKTTHFDKLDMQNKILSLVHNVEGNFFGKIKTFFY